MNTRDLCDALENRKGVQKYVVGPYEHVEIKNGPSTKIVEGPAIILINKD
ncbi:BC1881 family protein [Weissella viridescens]|nr:BC1881 family protein [uncultured Weissella sp.]